MHASGLGNLVELRGEASLMEMLIYLIMIHAIGSSNLVDLGTVTLWYALCWMADVDG